MVKQLTHRDRAGKPIQVDAHAFSFVENTNLQSHHLGAELRRQRGTVVAQELWCGMCLREGSSGRAKLLTMRLRPSEAPTIGTMPLKLGGSCICPWGSPVSHSSPAMRVWLTEITPWETANGLLTSPFTKDPLQRRHVEEPTPQWNTKQVPVKDSEVSNMKVLSAAIETLKIRIPT